MVKGINVKCAVIVPTRNAGPLWPEWLSRLQRQEFCPQQILVIDSSSTDETAGLAINAGLEVEIITPIEFNHGGTRNLAASRFADVDILIFLTQDALLASPQSLKHLVSCFDKQDVAAVYGRQLPHDDANPIATHARLFNYPESSLIKSKNDIPVFGIKTAFMSNSFSAYRRNNFV